MNKNSKCFLIALGILTFPLQAKLCRKWSKSTIQGTLNKKILKEASGLAISQHYPKRLYHINDKGDCARFYITDQQGKNSSIVNIYDLKAKDFEDLSLGPCGDKKQCIYIADIGDNYDKRKKIKIIAIEELQTFSNKPISPLFVIKMKYPDNPHNAESFAIHPNGDFFIITKETPIKIYRLEKKQLSTSKKTKTLFFVGQLDIPQLRKKKISSFDIAPDGKKIVILTKKIAIEIAIDLTKKWQNPKDYQIIPLAFLPRPEAISYSANGKEIIYSSEYKKPFKHSFFKTKCIDPAF